MTDKKVKVFRSGEGSAQTAQTVGMQREELVSTPNARVGMVQTEPGFTSGWHHHGDYDTYVYIITGELKLDFGEAGKESCVAKAGEVAVIPKDTVHRESNPSSEKQFLFGVRVGQGAPVFNVDGPVGQ
jgi:quercetin dioxygenase-like cupin family protein